MQNEHILGLVLGNDNWWRTHGPGCSTTDHATLVNQTEKEPMNCALSYVVRPYYTYSVCGGSGVIILYLFFNRQLKPFTLPPICFLP